MIIVLRILLLLLCISGHAVAQSVSLAPVPIQRFYDNNNIPLVGGQLFIYQSGTLTKATSYINSGGLTPNTNPVILNARGEPRNVSGASVGIWLPSGSYKFVLSGPSDSDPPVNPIWTVDGIVVGNNAPGVMSAASFGAIDISSGNVTGQDSSSALNAALGWCGAAPGRAISLGSGRYVVSASSITVPRNCELQAAAAPNPENAASPINGFVTVGGAILLGLGQTIDLAGTLRNVSVFPAGLTEPTGFQSAAAAINGWTGTGVTVTGDNAKMYDTFILGFNQGYNATNVERPTIDHADFDNTNNMFFSNIQDVGHISAVHSWPYYNGNTAFQMYSGRVLGVSNNGTGLIRLTVDTTANFATGNTIQVRGVSFQSANGNWPNITVVNGSQIDLNGSSFAPFSETATWGSGNTNVINVPSLVGVWYGETVSGTNIQAGTTVMTTNPLNGDVWLSNATTGAGPQTVLFTSSPYTGGGTDTLNLATRNGTNRLVQNSAQMSFTDMFEFGWQIGYHNTTTASNSNDWTIDVNTSCDQFDDPSIICMLIDGRSTLGEWIGGQGGGNAIAYVDNAVAATSNQVLGVQLRNSVATSLETPAVAILNPSPPAYVKFDGFGANSFGLPAYVLPYNTQAFGNLMSISGFFQGSGIQLMYPGFTLPAGAPSVSGALTGIWTPSLQFGGTSVEATASGHYVIDDMGNMTASFDINNPTLGPSGITQISGLPFWCADFFDNRAGTFGVGSANMTGLTNGLFSWEPGGSMTTFSIGTTVSTGTTNVGNSNFTSSSDIYGTFTCRTR